MNKIPHHTSIARGTYRDDHGTPPEIIELVRSTFGRIDIDLASSAEHNKVVRAGMFFTVAYPCPDRVETVPDLDVVWCNPPGPLTKVRWFWDAWCGAMRRGGRGAFLIYNMDHWRCLPEPYPHMSVLVLRKRLRFVGATSQASFPSAVVFSGTVFHDSTVKQMGHWVQW